MDSIVNHHNHPSITTYQTNLTEGCVNPLRRTSYKKTININSRFRDNYTITPASDFYFNIPESLDNVVSMKLDKIIIPKFIYTVNQNTGSDNFEISFIDDGNPPPAGFNNGNITKTIRLPSGSYTGQSIATVINNIFDFYYNQDILNNWPFQYIRCKYDSFNGKISFNILWQNLTSVGSIKLNFNYIDPQPNNSLENSIEKNINFCKNSDIYSQIGSNIYKDQLTLGWLLGFRGEYKYNTPKTSVINREVKNFLTTGNSHLSRKELKNLHNIRPRRARETPVKENGLTYLEQTYNCCNINGFMNYPSPYDISYVYHLNKPVDLTPPSTLGWTYSAESIYDPLGNRYFLLSVNDYQNHHNNSFISVMQEETLNDSHLLAKIYGACGGECCCENQERIYFGPTSISRLHIKLLDEFGRIVDLNNGDYSFTLELEILYDL